MTLLNIILWYFLTGAILNSVRTFVYFRGPMHMMQILLKNSNTKTKYSRLYATAQYIPNVVWIAELCVAIIFPFIEVIAWISNIIDLEIKKDNSNEPKAD